MKDSENDKNKLREWVEQMTQSHRRQLLQILAEDATLLQETSAEMAASQLRRIADERGLDWESLSESDREHFLDLLIREDAEATQANIAADLTYRKTICLQCGRDLTPHDLYRIYFSHRPPSAGLVAGKLLVVDSEAPQVQFSIPPETEILIGRLDPNRGIRPEVDLSPYDPAARVSRRHARIMVRGAQFFIEDLGSANGTFINGRIRLRPQQLHLLESGDTIRIGQTSLQFLTARVASYQENSLNHTT